MLACYTLRDANTSFDFAVFLAAADVAAHERGFSSFEVALVRNVPLAETKNEVEDHVSGSMNMEWRLRNIVYPLAAYYPRCRNLTLIECAEDFSRVSANCELYPQGYSWGFTPFMDYREAYGLIRSGNYQGFVGLEKGRQIVRSWLASSGVRTPFVTITVRHREWQPERNSNLSSWVRFASLLNNQSLGVVFIPDSDTVMQQGSVMDDFAVFEPACWNIGLRLAIYELAHVNFGVANGPMELANLSRNCSCIQFRPNLSCDVANFEYYEKSMGLDTSHPHMPGATSRQLTIWGSDDFPSIQAAYTTWNQINGIEPIAKEEE